MSEPRYPQTWVEAPSAMAEELTAALFQLGAQGVEQRDDTTLYKGPGAGQVLLIASFAREAQAQLAAASVSDEARGVMGRLEVLVGDGWRDKYKAFFVPLRLTAGVTVAPPWEDYEAAAGEAVLVMDPGRAFGTGLHATTSLVAASLAHFRQQLQGQALLDVGTGSGILALTGLLLGASRAVMTDNDPIAVEVARDNAQRNGLLHRCEISTQQVAHVPARFLRIVANIRAHVLIAMAPALLRRLLPGGVLSLSGVLRSERAEVEQAFEQAGAGALQLVRTTERGDAADAWMCLDWRRRAVDDGEVPRGCP